MTEEQVYIIKYELRKRGRPTKTFSTPVLESNRGAKREILIEAGYTVLSCAKEVKT